MIDPIFIEEVRDNLDFAKKHDGADDWLIEHRKEIAAFALALYDREITLAEQHEPDPTPPTALSGPPKDGRMLCLLVDYSDGDHPLEDAKQAWTIGYNTLANTGDDEWLIAGWSWEQDCYTDGRGAVIGWLPFPCDPTPTPALGWRAMQTAAAEMLQAASAKCRENFTYPAKTKEQRDWQTGAIINSNAAAAIRTLPSPTDAQLLAEAVKLPEIAAMQDKIDGLASDLEEVAFRHGAVDWVRLNYPQQYAALAKIGGAA